jgi:hypothetical protein
MSVKFLAIFFYLVTSLSAWITGYIIGKDFKKARVPARYGLAGLIIWGIVWFLALMLIHKMGWFSE